MDIFKITETRWSILKELANQEESPKKLAQKLNLTLANTSHQLKFLEASGFVQRKKPKNGKEQRIVYALKDQTILGLKIGKNPSKIELRPSHFDQLLFNLIGEKSASFILTFLLTFQEAEKKIDKLALKDEHKEEIHLVVITQDVNLFREKNEYDITIGEKTKKIIFWSHTVEEIEQGLNTQDAYFQQLVKDSKCLYEK